MTYTGKILALDLASNSGVAEGRPGETPRLYDVRLRKDTDGDDYEATWGRAISWIADRLYVERDAVAEGDLRVVIEAPIMTGGMSGKTNADSLLVTKGLWACVSGFARARGVMVRRVAVSTVRKGFLGNGRLAGDEAKRQAAETCRALGWAPTSLDAADAGALWWWGCNEWAPKLAPEVHPLLLKRGAA